MDSWLISCFILLFISIICQAKTTRSSKVNRNIFQSFAEEARDDDDPQCVVAEELYPEFRYFTPNKKEVDIINNRHFTQFQNTIKSTLNVDAQTVFIIHGYLGGNATWAVDFLPGFDPKKVHIVGHSLGAHASGYAGKWVKDQGFKVGRITGLDPAGPDFNELTACQRLDRSDADFVDVIHTNWAGQFWGSVSGFGLEAQVGHFDFYPNGGEDQPGCKTAGEAEIDIALDLYSYLVPAALLGKLLSGGAEETKAKLLDLSCSHGRAYEYFYWSLKDKGCRFSADECPSWEMYNRGEYVTPAEKLPKIQMGYYSYKYKERIQSQRQWRFYLRTTSSKPYCEK